MTWGFAGAAAISATMSMVGAQSSANASARAAGAQSRAEGEAVAKERLNTTVRNAYNTSFAQMQLAQKKQQLAQQGADISAASLAAHGSADAVNAATGSVGASTQAVSADISQKVQSALDTTTASAQDAMQNYNRELDMMVINTDQTTPNVPRYEYTGPSGGEMLGLGLAQGLATFASGYAMRKMQLGLGPKAGV